MIPLLSREREQPQQNQGHNGITGWKTNYPVGGYKVDVAFPNQKVAIETDGWAFHSR